MNYKCKVCLNYCVCEYCKYFVPDEIEEYTGFCEITEHRVGVFDDVCCVCFECMKDGVCKQ